MRLPTRNRQAACLTACLAACLATFVLALGSTGPAGAQGEAQTAPLPGEQNPSAADDAPLSADPALPPPILPAPDLPLADPLVELPPVEASKPGDTAQPGPPLTADGKPFSFADLAEGLLDSVVYISTSQNVSIDRQPPVPKSPAEPDAAPDPRNDEFFEEFFDDEGRDRGSNSRSVQSLGSGFVIDPTGLIVTNNHVITDADEIVANFGDGRKFTAEVVGIDDKTDLALLKVDPPTPLKAVKFGRSEGLRIGDWVLAIGNPFGFGGTVTAGIVSALDRDINSGPYDHYIQTDASINRGNSGGPLFNIGGEVVGINTAIMSPTGGSIGIGFSVPTEIAVPVIEQLRQFGEVRRGWIGVRIQDVTEAFAEGVGLAGTAGALIAGVNPGSPAETAGIKAGDVVVEFNGKPVDTMRALPRAVADTPPGEAVDMVVVRDGKRLTLKIAVGLLAAEEVAAATAPTAPGADAKEARPSDSVFGLTLGSITEDARKTYAIDAALEGVLVTGVDPGSEAEKKDVKAGDVIVQVSTKAVAVPQDVAKRVEELKTEGRRTVMFLMSGAQSKLRFVSLRFDSNP